MANEVTTAKILIVDDEPTNVRLLERLLRPAGIGTSRARGTPAVSGAYQAFGPDLILLDLLMPHLTGLVCSGSSRP